MSALDAGEGSLALGIAVWLGGIGALLVVLAAGHVLVRRLVDGATLAESVVHGVGASIVIVSTVSFCVAWALDVGLTAPVVLGVSVGLLMACRPWSLPAMPPARRGDVRALALLLLAAFALVAVTTFRPVQGRYFVDICLYRSSIFLHEFGRGSDPGWLIHGLGVGDMTYVLPRQDGPIFGIYSVIAAQRPANGAIAASFFSLLDGAGPVYLSVLLFFGVAGGGFLVASGFVESWLARAAVGVLTAAGAHGVAAFMVNETVFAFLAGILLLAWLLRSELPAGAGVLAGAMFGFGVGSRFLAAAWTVPVVVLLTRFPRRSRVAVASGAVVAVAPWLAVNLILRGSLFYHPNPPDALVEHSILGLTFRFRPLNWPVYDTLVRAPGHVMPPLLLLPVLVLRSLGVVVAAAATVGFAVLAGRDRKTALALALWALPVAAFLHVLAYLDDEKASWLLMAFPVLPAGLATFANELRVFRKRSVVAASVLAIGLGLVPRVLTSVEVPEDPRGYEVIEPDTPERDVHVRYGDKWQEELSSAPILPGFHHMPWGLSGLSMLAPRERSRSHESGRIVLVLDNINGPVDVSFPVHASLSPPPLPSPDPGAQVPSTGTIRGRFILVGLDASPEVRVHVTGHITDIRSPGEVPDDVLQLDIDPGPPPHERRYVGLLAMRPWEPDSTVEATKVTVGGAPIPLRALGFEARDARGEVKFFPSVQTNLRLPAQRPAGGLVREGDHTWHFTWVGREPPPAEDQPGSSDPVLDVEGPFVY